MKPKHRVGIKVEFLNSRYLDDEYRYYDYNLKYSEGASGFVIQISDEPSIDDNTGINEYHYTIKTSNGNIIDVPESDLTNPNATLQEKVEQRLKQKQQNKKFKDTGDRVGGSAKEKRAYKYITLDNLKNLEQDEDSAIEYVKKDRIYTSVDVNLEIENGVSSGTAFLKTKLREMYPTSPINKKRRDAYVGYASVILELLEKVYTHKQFLEFVEYLKENTYDILLELLEPEIYAKKILQQEENSERKNLLEYSLIPQVTFNIEEEIYRLRELYPDNYDSRFNYYNIKDTPLKDRMYIEALTNEKVALNDELAKLNQEYSDDEKDFLVSLIERVGGTKQNERIIEKNFGERFLKFLYPKKEPYNKLYELAVDYDSLSKIESEIAIEKNTEQLTNEINNKKQKIEESKNLFYLEELKKFFIENSNWRFKGGSFGNRFFTAYDIKNITQANNYRQRWINVTNDSIKKLEEDIELGKIKYREREDNWEWFTNRKNKTQSTEKSDLKINSVPPLSFINRVGGYIITESDISPESIRDKFGFKSVEFGQSLEDKEANEHIKHFLGGMADLGDILDLNIFKLNIIGGLSIAFASRGSGKAIATYNDLGRIINITKSRGGGALAHEYLHYIDNIIPKINRTNYSYQDWASVDTAKGKYYNYERPVNNSSVKKAIDEIFDFIYFKKVPIDLKNSANNQSFISVKIPKTEKLYNIPQVFNNGEYTTIEEYIDLFFRSFPNYEKDGNLNKKAKDILGSIVSKFGYDEYEFQLMTNKSNYYINSLAMKSPYWTQEYELFARAFETYIFDKLAINKRSNNYLVSGGYFDRAEGVYPIGSEREVLNELYDRFIETIKFQYELDGFKSWTKERVDEYIVLNDDSTDKTGVILDSKTGELIEKLGEYTELQQKFIKLAEMLKGKKYKKKK